MVAPKIKRWLKYITTCCLVLIIFVVAINSIVSNASQKYIYNKVSDVPKCYTGLVLGAKVHQSGNPSDYLEDRLNVAIELYRAHKISRFLLSADHGQREYDEVNAMKQYLLDHGIDTKDIFLDHAGFDTHSSMVRAKEVFKIKDVIVVTQNFHLSRAVYLARGEGLTAYGVIADRRNYAATKYLERREILANIKAVSESVFHKRPKFLGDSIPITGDSKLSYD